MNRTGPEHKSGNRRAAVACIALVALCVPAVLFAATVTGTVRDAETGSPLAFVTVQVIGETERAGKINRGAMCGEDGNFTLDGIPAGRYVLRCSRVGYATYEDSLIVSADREYRRDVALAVQPVEVEEIVVKADRFERERKVQTGFVSVKATELAELPGIIEGDPVRSLQLLPGVQAASDISSGLYIRGGGPDQTLVQLDGVPVYNPTHAFGFFSTFNADALEEVNLYKGAYPARYSGRLGAVLDVNSSDGNRREVSGAAGVSTIAARLTLEGPVSDGGTWMVGGRRTYLEPLLNALSTPESPLPSYYFYDVNAKLSTARTNRGGLTLSTYFGRDKIDYELDSDTQLNLDWGNTLVSAGYGVPLGESLLAGVKFFISQYRSDTDLSIFTTPIVVDNRIQDATLRGEVTWFPSARHRLTAGIQGTQYNVYYRQDFNQENSIDYRRRTYEGSLFVEDEWSVSDGTAVRGGAQFRYLDDGGRFLFEPRLSVVRPLRPQFRLKMGAGVYNQYLQLVTTEGFSAADFYVPIDDTAPPSRSWQTVLGFEWEPARQYKLSVEGYYTGLGDLVVLDDNSQPEATGLTAEDIFYTGGDGYQTGVELFAERRTGALTGWVGYTLGWTRRQFSELNQGNRFPPKYDRRHDLSVVTQYRTGKWRFGVNFIYATGQAFTPVSAWWFVRNPVTGVAKPQLLAAERNSSRLLPYNRMDLSASREFTMFGRPADVYLQIFNVYSRRNDWFVQYDVNMAGEDSPWAWDEYYVDPVIVRQLPIIPSIGLNFEF
jgi:hypothetical protein